MIVEVDAVVDQRRALEVKILLDAANYQTLSAVGVLNAGLRQMVRPLDQLLLGVLLEQTVYFALRLSLDAIFLGKLNIARFVDGDGAGQILGVFVGLGRHGQAEADEEERKN